MKSEIPPIFRDRLCPLADIITPNHFEFEWLCAAKAATIEDVAIVLRNGAIDGRRDQAQLADRPGDRLETIAIEGSRAWRLSTPKLPIRPSGTGDPLASLFVAALMNGSDTPGALEDAVSATLPSSNAPRPPAPRK